MRRVIGILVAMALLCGVAACSSIEEWDIGRYVGSITVLGAESSNTTEVEGNIMAVFYTRAEERVLFWVADAQIIDRGDGKWDVTSPQRIVIGISQALTTYGLYQYQPFSQPTYEAPVYLEDLDLQPITADDLPKSQHIGKLTAVNPALARPATIVRKYMSVTYDVQCLISQAVVDMWVADTLNVNDFVIVSFIEEIPDTTEVNIAIVVDKVYESWGS